MLLKRQKYLTDIIYRNDYAVYTYIVTDYLTVRYSFLCIEYKCNMYADFNTLVGQAESLMEEACIQIKGMGKF